MPRSWPPGSPRRQTPPAAARIMLRRRSASLRLRFASLGPLVMTLQDVGGLITVTIHVNYV